MVSRLADSNRWGTAQAPRHHGSALVPCSGRTCHTHNGTHSGTHVCANEKGCATLRRPRNLKFRALKPYFACIPSRCNSHNMQTLSQSISHTYSKASAQGGDQLTSKVGVALATSNFNMWSCRLPRCCARVHSARSGGVSDWASFGGVCNLISTTDSDVSFVQIMS